MFENSHKVKSGNFTKKMNEVRTNKIEIKMNQDKIGYINYAHNEEITYWKKATLERFSTENEEKELIDLASSRVSLIPKVKSATLKNLLLKQ